MLNHFILIATCAFYSSVFGQECGRFSCHGDVGNLVAGRSIQASSSCGEDKSEIICHPITETCLSPQCRRCRAGKRGHEHPSSYLTDSIFFHPRTWWQASNDVSNVTLTFNLETTFYFTHLIIVFRSPRPGAMTIEKSSDFGETWKIYQHFARSCKKTFSMDDDQEVEGAKCTSRYSSPTPCHKGEVIYRVMNPLNLIDDPYSDEARHLLKITNIRIKMWNPQICPTCENRTVIDSRLTTRKSVIRTADESNRVESILINNSAEYFTRFAIYDLIIRGTCFCNGHADTCVPLHEDNLEPTDLEQDVVHGKCLCEHNTAGDHCGECLPLYNDIPWRPGNGDTGAANPCKKCKCHGHSNKCTFDMEMYMKSGNRSGGLCQDCQHNTAGRHCEKCKPGYFRRPDSELSDQDVCEECLCNRIGSITFVIDIDGTDDDVIACDSMSGQCRCKQGVGGKRCDRCLKGFWGLGVNGCLKCSCKNCDRKSGICLPKYGDEEISFMDVPPETEISPGYDLTGIDWEREFPSTENLISQYNTGTRLPNVKPDMLPVYIDEPYIVSRSDIEASPSREAASWRLPSICKCKNKDLKSHSDFCKMKYDYAVRVKVREATDYGTHASLTVYIRRVLTQGQVNIRRGKAVMFPKSWTIMGCTCPFLKPGVEYLVIGHEDPISGRLEINVTSIVERWWNRGKDWSRTIKKYNRKPCKATVYN